MAGQIIDNSGRTYDAGKNLGEGYAQGFQYREQFAYQAAKDALGEIWKGIQQSDLPEVAYKENLGKMGQLVAQMQTIGGGKYFSADPSLQDPQTRGALSEMSNYYQKFGYGAGTLAKASGHIQSAGEQLPIPPEQQVQAPQETPAVQGGAPAPAAAPAAAPKRNPRIDLLNKYSYEAYSTNRDSSSQTSSFKPMSGPTQDEQTRLKDRMLAYYEANNKKIVTVHKNGSKDTQVVKYTVAGKDYTLEQLQRLIDDRLSTTSAVKPGQSAQRGGDSITRRKDFVDTVLPRLQNNPNAEDKAFLEGFNGALDAMSSEGWNINPGDAVLGVDSWEGSTLPSLFQNQKVTPPEGAQVPGGGGATFTSGQLIQGSSQAQNVGGVRPGKMLNDLSSRPKADQAGQQFTGQMQPEQPPTQEAPQGTWDQLKSRVAADQSNVQALGGNAAAYPAVAAAAKSSPVLRGVLESNTPGVQRMELLQTQLNKYDPTDPRFGLAQQAYDAYKSAATKQDAQTAKAAYTKLMSDPNYRAGVAARDKALQEADAGDLRMNSPEARAYRYAVTKEQSMADWQMRMLQNKETRDAIIGELNNRLGNLSTEALAIGYGSDVAQMRLADWKYRAELMLAQQKAGAIDYENYFKAYELYTKSTDSSSSYGKLVGGLEDFITANSGKPDYEKKLTKYLKDTNFVQHYNQEIPRINNIGQLGGAPPLPSINLVDVEKADQGLLGKIVQGVVGAAQSLGFTKTPVNKTTDFKFSEQATGVSPKQAVGTLSKDETNKILGGSY